MNKLFTIVGFGYNHQTGSYFNCLTMATLKQFKNCYSGLVNGQRMKFTREANLCETGHCRAMAMHCRIDPNDFIFGNSTYCAFESMAEALAYIKRYGSYGVKTSSIQPAIDKFTQALADEMSI